MQKKILMAKEAIKQSEAREAAAQAKIKAQE